MKWLLIGDPHAHPEYDNDRFDWLGRHIIDAKPDIIVCIGDFADMPSLSSYDRGTKGFEGRRYWRDVAAAQDAQTRMLSPMWSWNARRRKNKKNLYLPRMYMTLGNHENRIDRVVNSTPELDGTLSVDDLGYTSNGWELIPFQDVLSIHNWQFSHYFATGVSGRPISGENIGRTLLSKNFSSSVQGHSHVLDYAQRTAVDGKKMHGMSIGCYSHPGQIEGWNSNTVRMWWYGIVEMHTDDDGDLEQLLFINQKTLKDCYD